MPSYSTQERARHRDYSPFSPSMQFQSASDSGSLPDSPTFSVSSMPSMASTSQSSIVPPTDSVWTEGDDMRLRAAVENVTCGKTPSTGMVSGTAGKSWSRIALVAFPHGPHDREACAARWKLISKPQSVKGPWSQQEDKILAKLVDELGAERWVAIAERLGTRSGKQCRERWHNHIDPSINKAPFTHEEDALIIQMYEKMGSKWAEMSKVLKGRPDNAIKNHYNTTLIRRRKLLEAVNKVNEARSLTACQPTASENPFFYQPHVTRSEGTASPCSTPEEGFVVDGRMNANANQKPRFTSYLPPQQRPQSLLRSSSTPSIYTRSVVQQRASSFTAGPTLPSPLSNSVVPLPQQERYEYEYDLGSVATTGQPTYSHQYAEFAQPAAPRSAQQSYTAQLPAEHENDPFVALYHQPTSRRAPVQERQNQQAMYNTQQQAQQQQSFYAYPSTSDPHPHANLFNDAHALYESFSQPSQEEVRRTSPISDDRALWTQAAYSQSPNRNAGHQRMRSNSLATFKPPTLPEARTSPDSLSSYMDTSGHRALPPLSVVTGTEALKASPSTPGRPRAESSASKLLSSACAPITTPLSDAGAANSALAMAQVDEGQKAALMPAFRPQPAPGSSVHTQRPASMLRSTSGTKRPAEGEIDDRPRQRSNMPFSSPRQADVVGSVQLSPLRGPGVEQGSDRRVSAGSISDSRRDSLGTSGTPQSAYGFRDDIGSAPSSASTSTSSLLPSPHDLGLGSHARLPDFGTTDASSKGADFTVVDYSFENLDSYERSSRNTLGLYNAPAPRSRGLSLRGGLPHVRGRTCSSDVVATEPGLVQV